MMSIEEIKFWTALIVLVTTIYSSLHYVYRKNKKAFYKTIKDNSNIQLMLEIFHKKYSEDFLTRVLVLATENGGGMPTKGKKLKASVLFESYDNKNSESIIHNWQNRIVDRSYNVILLRMLECTMDDDTPYYYETTVSELSDNSLLKTMWEAEDIKGARLYYIGQIYWKFLGLIRIYPKKMVYISLTLHSKIKDKRKFDSDCLNIIHTLRKELL